MTFKVRKSQAPNDLGAQVETYRKAMLAHRLTTNVAAPTAPFLVTSCVRRVQHPIKANLPDDFVTDYEIIDDTPPPLPKPPEPTLEEKKSVLRAVIMAEENALIEKATLSPGKARLFALDVNEALAKDPNAQTDADKILINTDKQYAVLILKIRRWGATQMVAVDDLTEDTIGKWAMQAYVP